NTYAVTQTILVIFVFIICRNRRKPIGVKIFIGLLIDVRCSLVMIIFHSQSGEEIPFFQAVMQLSISRGKFFLIPEIIYHQAIRNKKNISLNSIILIEIIHSYKRKFCSAF